MKTTVSLTFLAQCLFLLVTATGCSLCCAPYDYCGPVFADGHCANLARQRCGTAFNGPMGCNGGAQVIYDENGQPISVPTAQQPTPATYQNMETVPTPAPKQQLPPGGHLYKQPATAQNTMTQPMAQNTMTQSATVQAQFQHASAYNSAQRNLASAATSGSTDSGASTVVSTSEMPTTIPVNADGYQRVAVYDENQKLLGYEMIDATGKSVHQLPAPAHVQ
ncbi:MAG: hypothetical protein Q4C70_08880 [Planctomycetia bacterium]|nr:hypothetical protein [Planctomycetia bacterium]